MYRGEEIRGVHLELTTRCNAACPMCPRNVSGGRTTDYLPLVELSLADIKTIFPPDLARQLRWLYMCGNYGDALAARDTLEIFAYLRGANPKMELKMITNGGGRDAAWWAKLAGVVSSCTFSIDGLEDTNHLYRRGVEWRKLMTAVKAFRGAGGKAEWDFLVFKHNEHQVEAARALAKDLGFFRFNVKRTARFLVNGRPVDRKPVLDDDGAVEYHLEMPASETMRNSSFGQFESAAASGQAYRAYLDETPVTCKVLEPKQIYVSAEGLVFPCCWTAKLYDKPGRRGEEWRLVEKLPGGTAALDAKLRPVREIVDGPYFQSLIPGTWQPGSPARQESAVCMRICGARDAVRAQKLPE